LTHNALVLQYILLVLVSIGISLLDLLAAGGYLPLSIPGDDIPLVDDERVRLWLGVGSLVFLVRAIVAALVASQFSALTHTHTQHSSSL
jgi:hypothetical protein